MANGIVATRLGLKFVPSTNSIMLGEVKILG
jgi:hypothetical protein